MRRPTRHFTSRWIYPVAVALAIAAGWTQNRVLLIVLYVLLGFVLASVLLEAIPVFKNIRRARGKNPCTKFDVKKNRNSIKWKDL